MLAHNENLGPAGECVQSRNGPSVERPIKKESNGIFRQLTVPRRRPADPIQNRTVAQERSLSSLPFSPPGSRSALQKGFSALSNCQSPRNSSHTEFLAREKREGTLPRPATTGRPRRLHRRTPSRVPLRVPVLIAAGSAVEIDLSSPWLVNPSAFSLPPFLPYPVVFPSFAVM